MTQNNSETALQTPVTPDFKHRYADLSCNNLIHATAQIQTVLSLLYPNLEPKKELPPAHVCTVERLHQSHESEKAQILDALFIIDSLSRDIEAIANTIES